MVSKNDITGDTIQTKSPSDLYRDNWEKIFGKERTEEQLGKLELDDVPSENK